MMGLKYGETRATDALISNENVHLVGRSWGRAAASILEGTAQSALRGDGDRGLT